MSEVKVIAKLTLHGVADMDMHQRMELARWMHEQAMSLMAEGPRYSNRFTARYILPNEVKV